MRRGTPYRIADNRQMHVEAQRTGSSPVSAEFRLSLGQNPGRWPFADCYALS